MSEPNVTWEELAEGVTRPDGETHQLIVRRVRAHLVEFEDANFHFNSAVLMARPRRTVSGDGGGDLTGIALVAGVLKFAEDNPDKRAMVAGHTDLVGPASYNMTLSEQRANNAHALIGGDRDGWADNCQGQHRVEDWQRILKWIDETHGYDCDPGDVDNRYGTRSRRARERFRVRYNAEFEASLTVRGQQRVDDWKAFFDMYDLSLAQLLGVETSELQPRRDGVTFVDPAVLACGEQWPKEGRGDDNLRSEMNRRVEVIFFDEGELDDFAGEDPPGRSLYAGTRRYPRRRVPIAGVDWIGLDVVDLNDNPVPSEGYELDLPHGVTRTGALLADGTATFADIPPGECALRFPDVEQAHAPESVPTGARRTVVVQRRSILVKVQSSFLHAGVVALENLQVEDAVIELPDEGRDVVHDNDGRPVPLDVTDLADGEFLLKISPRDDELSSGPAGPDLEPDAGVAAAFRPLEITLTLVGGEITAAVLVHSDDKHGRIVDFDAGGIEVDLKPDWLESPNRRPRGGAGVDMVVIQHNGATTIQPTFEAYRSTAGKASSAHYVIDTDGFVVKMVRDADAACHCRYARWAGNTNVRERSVAVELVHDGGALSAPQQQALVDLTQALVAHHGFSDTHVVALADVATARTDPHLVGRKVGDPGPDFDWALLEAENLGPRLTGAAPGVFTMYDGVLVRVPSKIDKDSGAVAITELQDDLIAIGYQAKSNGTFDKYTRAAVRQFVLHFVTHARAPTPPLTRDEVNGRIVSFATATYIKQCTTW